MYKTIDEEIVIEDGKSFSYSPSLQPNFAKVYIEVGNEAEIWIDGERTAISKWTGNLLLGSHILEAKLNSHVSTVKEVEITDANAQKRFILDSPIPIYGGLDIDVSPAMATVYVDDEEIGTTPMITNKILVGEHVVRIHKVGYELLTSRFIAKEGEIFELKGELGEDDGKFSLRPDSFSENSEELKSVTGYVDELGIYHDSGSKNLSSEIKGKVMDEAYKTKQEFKVYDMIEQMPSFPGGVGELMKYLSANIKYPQLAEANGIQGRVICTFVVGEDGSVSNIQVVKGVDPLLDEEAVRVISLMPKWIPGKKDGNPVNVKYTLPITFRLGEPEIKNTELNVSEEAINSI